MSFIKISAPQMGVMETVQTSNAEVLILEFPTSEASFDRVDNNLEITFDDGGVLVLADYFVDEGEGLPAFQMADGEQYDGAAMLQALNPAIDISPAAGPSVASLSGSGAAYSDESGNLVNGLDGLGKLGIINWSEEMDWRSISESLAPILPEQGELGSTLPDGGDETGSTPPDGGDETGSIPPDGGGEPKSYHARLIVTTATDSSSFKFMAQDEYGNLVSDPTAVSIVFKNGTSQYFNDPVIDPVTGEISVTLTAEGLAALGNGLYFEDYLIVTVNGTDYPVHLVGNEQQSYDYNSEEGKFASEDTLVGEWYNSVKDVSGETVTLGGKEYNSVEINNTLGSGSAYGLRSSDIIIDSEGKADININAESSGSAYGLSSTTAGYDLNIQGNSNTTINVNAVSHTTGAAASYNNNADTTINTGDVSLNATVKSGGYGIYSAGGSNVNVTADKALEVGVVNNNSSANNSYVYGVYNDGAANTVNLSGHDVGISAHSDMGNAYAVMSNNGAKLNITAAPDGKLSVVSSQDYASSTNYGSFQNIGVVSYNGSTTHLKGGDIYLESTINASQGIATAAYAGRAGQTIIEGYDNQKNTMTFNATGNAAHGMLATANTYGGSGQVLLKGGNQSDNVTINATANSVLAIGLFGEESGRVKLDGGDGQDTVTINSVMTGNAVGGDPKTGDRAGAYGMATSWAGAKTEIDNFEDVNINVTHLGKGGGAYGMYAYSDWTGFSENLIHNSSGGPISVTITVEPGGAAEAYAMYAKQNGSNIIRGGSQEGDEVGDQITLQGGMKSGGNAFNLIETGDGNDTVRVFGDIVGKNNTIKTGEGDDVIHLKGDAGSLTLEAGDGYDTLVLEAADWDTFKEHYGDWLKENFGSMSVESIHVNVSDESSMNQLRDYFENSPEFADIPVTYTYGGNMDMNGYLNGDGISEFSLGDILNMNDTDQLDQLLLGGGHENRVLIGEQDNSLLNGLKITGDADDSIVLQGNWQTNGNTSAPNGFTAFSSTYMDEFQNQQEVTLYIQNNISVDCM